MATVYIPSLLRDLAKDQQVVSVPGSTIGQVIDALEKAYPGIKVRLCNEQGLRPGIAVAVDTQITRLGLRQPVEAFSEIHFLPAVSGG
ncbi:MAG: MoaD/ThiS family protein [Gemmataceae bacterium]